MATRLERFRDHCREMAVAEHKPECPMLNAKEPWWPMWAAIDEAGDWCARTGKPMSGLGWLGPKPKWEPPRCDGCNPEKDRSLFAQLADEADEYLSEQLTLFA